MNFQEYVRILDEKAMMASSCPEDVQRFRDVNITRKAKILARDIVSYVLQEVKTQPEKKGVLLCEGTEESIDKIVYSAIFPELLIVPVGSCMTIMRLLARVRKLLNRQKLYAFGLIDRDALSKREIKKLREENLYSTKLPFIENIICTPEVLFYICMDRKLNYEAVLRRAEDEAIRFLWRHLKESLPINIGILKNEKIDFVAIQVATKERRVEKLVNRDSILYTYRDKVLINIVGNAVGIRGKKEYYEEIRHLLQMEQYRNPLIKQMSQYIPKFKEYEFESKK